MDLSISKNNEISRVTERITLDQIFKEAKKLEKHNFTPDQLDEIDRKLVLC